jgi:hypothetical protein
MADIRRIPFSEMVERLQKELVRDNSAAEHKYKSRINEIYMFDLPAVVDWRHIRKTATILTTADYSTGSISTTLSTAITGVGTSWTSANSNNMMLKVSGYDEMYRVTYSGATSLVADRAWVGTNISLITSYSLFQDRYALASDFDRLILDPDKSVYYYKGGQPIYLKWRDNDDFESKQTYTPNTPAFYTIKWVSGNPYIFVNSPDTEARTLNYVYMPLLRKMDEYIIGNITTLANGGTAVTGSGTAFSTYVSDTTNYDYYFRLDRDGTGGDSRWYRVTSAGSGTSLTLTDAYEGVSISGALLPFTISKCSILPPGLDLAIIYGAAITSASDQSNTTQINAWSSLYSKFLTPFLAAEGKQGYGSERLHSIYEKIGARR